MIAKPVTFWFWHISRSGDLPGDGVQAINGGVMTGGVMLDRLRPAMKQNVTLNIFQQIFFKFVIHRIVGV